MPHELRESGAAAILAHRSTLEFRDFLRNEFADMIEAGQWLALPYSVVRHLPNLWISPTGVVPQRDRRPWIIVDYSFYKVNQSILSVAPDSMQFGHATLCSLGMLFCASCNSSIARIQDWAQYTFQKRT
jgi:hypothetical protein